MKYANLLSSIRVNDLNGTAREMLTMFEGQNLSSYPDYEPFVLELSNLIERLTAAINRSITQSELADLDAERDKCFRNIGICLQATLILNNSSLQTDAERVNAIYNRYGVKITGLNYAAESSQIASFLKELEALNGGEIQMIPNLGYHISSLVTAQKTFEQKQKAYTDAVVQERGQESATDLKPQVISVINNNMVSYHNALAQFKDEAFQRIAANIDQIINEANALTRSRSKV